jgi:integrase
MASVDRRQDGRWRARWREYPGGPQRAKHFDRKIDADRFLVKLQHDLMTGSYIDPRQAQTPLLAYAEKWLERMRPTWRTTTAASVENSARLHILPVLGSRQIAAIKRSDIEAWAAALKLSPATVATVRQHLGQLLTAAVEDGLIARNPAAGAKMPKNETARPEPVPAPVIEAITEALPSWARVAVPLGLGAGLRQGEATGLTVDRVHFLRRSLRVDRQLVTIESARPELGPTKTVQSNRTIPLAAFVGDAVSAHLAEHGSGDLGVILHLPDGRPIGRNRFGRIWRAARTKAEADHVDFHDLRHTFASTLLSEGVSVRAVAEWMGHASPMVTLNTYSHMMPVDEDRARGVLDRALGARAGEDVLRTEAHG